MEKRKKRKHSSIPKDSFAYLIRSSALGLAASMICAAISLLIGAAICYFAPDPNKYIIPVGIIAIYLSAMVGGFVSRRLQGGDTLLSGGICGALLMLAFLFFTLFFEKEDGDIFSTGVSLILRATVIAASILGAFIGSRQRKAPRRRRK